MECKEDISILGIQLGAITHSFLPLLEEKAQSGVKINLLLLSPINESGDSLSWVNEFGRVHTFPHLSQILRNNIVRLADWYEELPSEIKANVNIRLYTTIPTTSILFLDKDKDDGSIKVEPIIYKFSPNERPSFQVTQSSSPKLYKKLVASFNNLWQTGVEINNLIEIMDRTS